MINHLPALPNLSGFAKWVSSGCSQAAVPDVWVYPPEKYMPELEDVDRAESAARQKYWLLWIVLITISTIVVCEGIRLIVWLCRRLRQKSCSAVRYTTILTPRVGKIDRKEMHLTKFLVVHITYHMWCASLVCIGLWESAVSMRAGIAWELWAMWQAMMVLSFLVQTVAWSCCSHSIDVVLQNSTCKVIILSMTPGLSESIDTMKDWCITGVCFFFGNSVLGAVLGLIVVLFDVMFLPKGPLMPLHVVLLLLLFLASGQGSLVHVFPMALTVVWCCLPPAACFDCVDAQIPIRPPLMPLQFACLFLLAMSFLMHFTGSGQGSLVNIFPMALTDGWFLGVLSLYIIIYSHVMVYTSRSPCRLLQKSFLGIYTLPNEAKPKVASSVFNALVSIGVEVFEDVTSATRLMIAWHEDWPQAFVGILLLLRYPVNSKFTVLSTILSAAKGILIPSFRLAVFKLKFDLLERKLVDITYALVVNAVSKWQIDGFPRGKLNFYTDTNKEETRDMLRWFTDGEFEVFRPIREKAARELDHDIVDKIWERATDIKEKLGLSIIDDIRNAMAHQLQDAGYMAEGLEVAHYTTDELRIFKVAGYIGGELKVAGYTLEELKLATYNVKDLRGFYTIAELRKGGYEVKDFKEADLPEPTSRLQSCWKLVTQAIVGQESIANFTFAELLEAGYTRSELTEAGYNT